MADRKLLGFQITAQKEAIIQDFCKERGIEYRSNGKSTWTHTLGSLAGIKGLPKMAANTTATGSITEEMIVFCGFAEEEIFAFLKEYREHGNPQVILKASVTMHNIFWTPLMLHEELKKEHQEMKG